MKGNRQVKIVDGMPEYDKLAALKIERLSDGSKVYGVNLFNEDAEIAITIEMTSLEGAQELLSVIEKHSIDTAAIY